MTRAVNRVPVSLLLSALLQLPAGAVEARNAEARVGPAANKEAKAGSTTPAGGHRQLLIDDFAVESTSGLTRVFHRPQRHPQNPVLTGSESWEKWTVDVNGHAVFYDDDTHQFRMWYVSALIDSGAAYGEHHRVGYAVSDDGIRWTKPELGQVVWAGSRRNNLLQWGHSWMRRPNIIKDSQDPDPTRRYKMLYSDNIEGQTAIVKAYSVDGIHWRLNGDGQPWFRGKHNSDLFGWDERIREYVHYVRMPGSPVSIGRSTSNDFISWSEPETVLKPVADEPEVNFMGFATFPYEGMYLGIIRVRLRTKKGWERAYAELASSRDGIRWSRCTKGKSFFEEGERGQWDDVMITMPAPVLRDGKLWFYYNGQNHPFGKEPLIKVQSGWVENGRRMETAIGVAMLRQDGFASLDAGSELGTLVTKPFTLPPGKPGGGLEVNADVRGELRVEIIDVAGNPIRGFGKEDCRPIKSDALNHAVHWDQRLNLEDESRPNLESLRGKTIRLRFQMRNASLYAFRFQ